MKYLLLACRPKQWTKNLIVFAAPFFSFSHILDVWISSFVCFISFCLISSSIYLFNDSIEFEHLVNKDKYNFVILLGDRYEILNIAHLATIFNIPIIHLYGGAVTTGAIDNQIRNAVSKMSHYHLVACKLYKTRLAKMGEEKNRIKESAKLHNQ